MSNIGTLLFHLRRIQQSSCQRQRAGLADCELPQGPAASAHFMFVLALYAHPRSSLGMNSLDDRNRVGVALLVLRVTVFAVMLVWTIDKFVRPAHATSVYEHFYFLRGLGPAIIYSIGIAELVLLIGFVIGFAPWADVRSSAAASRSLNFFFLPSISASVRRPESSLLRCLADARRVLYSLLPA